MQCNANENYVAPNPYDLSRPILLISDPSHLLKTARNALYSSKAGGTKYLCKNKEDILWTHVVDLVRRQEESIALQHCRLTADHIHLDSYSKMNVGLAKDVLSWSVSKSLTLLPNAQGTAKYVELFARLFDIVNCGNRNPMYSSTDERLRWLENDFLNYLLEWQKEVAALNECKRIIAPTTLEWLIFSTKNLIRLAEYLLQRGYKSVCLRICSQDVLEACFGNIRSHGRRCSNPDVRQASYAINHISTRKAIKKLKGGNVTYGTSHAWVHVCDEPMPKRKRT